MSVMRRGEAHPPRPSSGLTPGPSETDPCETRIPEIHSENEWDTENQGPGSGQALKDSSVIARRIETAELYHLFPR